MKKCSELIDCVDKDFYQKYNTPRKMASFLREIVSSTCNEYDVKPIKVSFKRLIPFVFADYRYSSGQIKINSYLYQNFTVFKNMNNHFYVFKMIESVLHETRHHLQFNDKNKREYHPIIKNLTEIAKYKQGIKLVYNGSYYSVPLEVDARHFTYLKMQDSPYLSKYLKSQCYIDNEKSFTSKPYDYKGLLKNSNDLFKPALNNINKSLGNILKMVSPTSNKDLSLYYSIAPSFKFEKSTLSEKENQKIKIESIAFHDELWNNVVRHLDRKYNLMKQKSQNENI